MELDRAGWAAEGLVWEKLLLQVSHSLHDRSWSVASTVPLATYCSGWWYRLTLFGYNQLKLVEEKSRGWGAGIIKPLGVTGIWPDLRKGLEPTLRISCLHFFLFSSSSLPSLGPGVREIPI